MAGRPGPTQTPTTEYSAFPDNGPPASPPSYPAAIGSSNSEGGELHRRLSLNSDASTESSINEDLEVASVTSSIEDRLTWRGRMQVVLHSHLFHYLIIALVALDALIVLCELLLDLGAFGNIDCEGEGIVEQAEFCHYSGRYRRRCGPPAALLLERINISAAPPLPNGDPGLGMNGLCRCHFRDGRRTCLAEEEVDGVNPALVLHYFSLFILSVFMVEIVLKFIAFRLKYFLPATICIHGHTFYFITFEMFDGMVVVISWILDIASLREEEVFELIDLVIILRLWRVVRVVNGAVLSAKARLDQQLHEARHHGRHVITALHKAQDKIDLLERDNQVFRQRLVHQTGNKVPPSLPQIHVDVASIDDEHTREE